MLSCEIKKNGEMIGYVYARNISGTEVIEAGVGLNTYHWEYFKPESRNANRGVITHSREDGIESLVGKILAEVNE